jgi:hypothetical protein
MKIVAARICHFAWAAALLIHPVISFSQTSQATLQGQVINQSNGQPVAGAVVIERDLERNTQSYRYTNDQGIYYFPALLPGTYSVRVDALGFRPEERSPVTLAVASRLELNFSLNATETSPQKVQAAPAQPNAKNILSVMYGSDAAVPQAILTDLPLQSTETLVAAVSSLITERDILELPLSGRDVYTLLVLQPGVSSDNATNRGLGFSVNGQRVGSSNFLLDGVDNNDLLVTGPATFVSADAVKEYRMTTNNYTADFGRASGFVANAVTRTGGNALHGTLLEFFNHTRLDANPFNYNAQGIARTPYHRDQYGGSLGGPLRKDRMFFFGNFERDRSSGQTSQLTTYLPTPQLISLLPDGPAKQLLTEFPPPNGTPIPPDNLFQQKDYVIPAFYTNTYSLGRVDYNSSDGRRHLSGRYALSDKRTENFFFSVYPGLNTPLTQKGQNLVLNYTQDLFRGTNELKFGYNRNTVGLFRPHPELPTIFSNDGILNSNLVVLPGMESSDNYAARNSSFDVVENFSRLFGRHALVAGAEWRLGLTDSLQSTFVNGQYFYQTWIEALANFNPKELLLPVNRFTGLPVSEGDSWRYYRQQEIAGFVQDNFKLTRRVSLNLGMRYEFFGVPAPRNGTADSNFVPGSGQTFGDRVSSGNFQNGRLYNRDWNNFAPRVGFSLDLGANGKNVLRGSFGVFFDRIFNNIWMNVRNNNAPLQCLLQISSIPGVAPLQEADSGCNFPTTQAQFSTAIPASQGVGRLNPTAVRNTATVAVDRNFGTPYSQNWFLGFQHELTRNLVVEVNQVGSLGRKLITTDFINRSGDLARTPVNPHGRFNPDHGDIIYYAPQGHSNHIAIQAEVRSRFTHGLQFQASYTYARTKDVQSDPLVLPISGSPALAASNLGYTPIFFRESDPNADYGNSDFDQRHNLTLNFVIETPRIEHLRWLTNRWQAAGLVGVRSGFPFSVVSFSDFVPGERETLQRADFTGTDLSQAFLSKRTGIPGGVQLLDPTKFQLHTQGPIGNLPRNSLYGPGFWNTDFSISRTFPVRGEQTRLQFRAEFYNLFNHTNLGNPVQLLTSSLFGRAFFGRQSFSSALPGVSPLGEQPRRIQLALRLNF